MGGSAEARPKGQQTGGVAALAWDGGSCSGDCRGKPSCGSPNWEARASTTYRLRKQRLIN